MKNYFLFAMLFIFLFSCNTTNNISVTVDGNRDDWKEIDYTAIDPTGDSKGDRNADLVSVKVYYDNNYLCLLLETDGKPFFTPKGKLDIHLNIIYKNKSIQPADLGLKSNGEYSFCLDLNMDGKIDYSEDSLETKSVISSGGELIWGDNVEFKLPIDNLKDIDTIILKEAYLLFIKNDGFIAMDRISPITKVTEEWTVVSNNNGQFKIVFSNPGYTGEGNFVIKMSNNGLLRTGYKGLSTIPFEKEYYTVGEMLFFPTMILKLPVTPGNKWSEEYSWHRQTGWEVESTIISTSDKIQIDDNIYKDCIQIKMLITGNGKLDPKYCDESWQAVVRGTKTIWIKKGVGIVKIEYAHENNTKSTIELVGSAINNNDINEYFPSSVSNRWKYIW